MKILAFAGSNSRASINKILAEYTAKQFNGAEVEVLDLNDYEMPIFSVDREKHDGIPTLALRFAEKIDAADLLIIALAEHNSSYTVAFKNVFDWVSRIKDRKHFGEKPVFLLATATGPGGGRHVVAAFEQRAKSSGANVLQSFYLPKFKETFDIEKGIVDEEKNAEFQEKLSAVKNFFG
ncbi:NADPH-dependent FMN reductase [Epilithonimonas arachidiradicis]|uniref:FMN reductase n=1 Tax=Epilithonimonas arachidiradicis TaxID=1617282 RepID=A0A420CMI2_9FLAO|nr:NAD(P)H-dependent oxidoreductase [Epilithonimonas arachidiradicis]RKE79545.1 NAD(P)H-dependent FMN reductase [Epilithonimonas arachidiradicis]GGG66075.1 FMN reductase [Epilithonimonas arachidiradicis]